MNKLFFIIDLTQRANRNLDKIVVGTAALWTVFVVAVIISWIVNNGL